jgi:hypothetical protein
VSTAESQDNQLCLYENEEYVGLIGCYYPNLDECRRINSPARSVANNTRYNIIFYRHDRHRRCLDGNIIEDVQPGQSRDGLGAPAYAYRAYDAG